ncbi:hypothetical protein D3C81_1540700 [compost metagenome]
MPAVHGQRQVGATPEQFGMRLATVQHPRHQRLLDSAIAPVRQQLGDRRGVVQGAAPAGVVDWAAVVGVDQAEVPVFIALVQVGHAGHGHAQQRLDQAVERAWAGDELGGIGQRLAQLLVFAIEQQAIDVACAGGLVGLVRGAPAAAQLGFAQGLLLPLP